MRNLRARPVRSPSFAARVITFALASFALGASCTTQPVLLPSRDFDRPTDVAFVCLETFTPGTVASGDGGTSTSDAGGAPDAAVGATAGALELTGRPMRVCHPRGHLETPQASLHTFAFLPNSSSGDLSVIDADRWHPVNLDPANAGYNRLPLGTLPTQIVASDDGCRLVTANHGSCDFSLVDPAKLLAPTVQAETSSAASVSTAGSSISWTVKPRGKKSGRALSVLPGEVAFLSEEEVDLVISALLEARKQARQTGAQWIASSGGAA